MSVFLIDLEQDMVKYGALMNTVKSRWEPQTVADFTSFS
jgi:hypothetical protein